MPDVVSVLVILDSLALALQLAACPLHCGFAQPKMLALLETLALFSGTIGQQLEDRLARLLDLRLAILAGFRVIIGAGRSKQAVGGEFGFSPLVDVDGAINLGAIGSGDELLGDVETIPSVVGGEVGLGLCHETQRHAPPVQRAGGTAPLRQGSLPAALEGNQHAALGAGQ